MRDSIVSLIAVFAVLAPGALHAQTVPYAAPAQSMSELMSQAQHAESMESWVDARSWYQEILAQRPGHMAALKGLSRAFKALGNASSALMASMEVFTRDREDTDNLLTIASLRGDLQDPFGQEFFLRSALAVSPHRADVHEAYAEFLASRGRTPEAEDHLSRAMALRPSQAEHHLLLADLAAKADDPAERLRQLSLAFQFDSASRDVNFAIAKFYLSPGQDAQQAVEYLQNCLEINPSDDEARYHLYPLLWRTGQSAQAEAIVSTLLRTSQPAGLDYADLLAARAVLLSDLAASADDDVLAAEEALRASRVDAGDEWLVLIAEEALVEPRRVDPSHPLRQQLADARVERGKAYLEEGSFQQAEFEFRRARRLAYSTERAKLLADLYLAQRQPDRYLAEMRRMAQVDPGAAQLDEDIEYYTRMLSDRLATRKDVAQYAASPYPRVPKLIVGNFQLASSSGRHLRFTDVWKEVLIQSLLTNPKLDVGLIADDSGSAEIQAARDMGGDFLIKGRVSNDAPVTEVTLEVLDLQGGQVIERLTLQRQGANRILDLAMSFVNHLDEIIQPVGHIVKSEGAEAVVNLGRNHGLAVGDTLLLLDLAATARKVGFRPEAITPELAGVVAQVTVTETDEALALIRRPENSPLVELIPGKAVVKLPPKPEPDDEA